VSVGVAQRAQDSLRRLKREIDPHLLAREKHDANYEDLYAAARQILDDEIGEVTNPLLADVLEKIKAASADLHVGGDHTTLYTNKGQDYGSSVVATLKGAKPARHAGVPYFAAVRNGDLKYIRYLASGEPEELYDLGADPEELTNLAGEPRRKADLERLRALWLQELRATDANFLSLLPPAQ
jgi:hypothetical protein